MDETPWGFSEVPPDDSQAAQRERARLVREAPQYPPAERPVFSEPKPAYKEKPPREKQGSSVSGAALFFGIAALALAMILYYRSNIEVKNAETTAHQALTEVGELRHNAGAPPTIMKLELTRTLRLLDSMAVEFGNEPEIRNKIEAMRNETLDLLYSIDEKAPAEPTLQTPPTQQQPIQSQQTTPQTPTVGKP